MTKPYLKLREETAARDRSLREKVVSLEEAASLVHDGDQVALTDPHFGPRALVAPRKTPPGLPIDAIPRDAFAVISHNHYDHLDAYSVDALGPASFAVGRSAQ